MHASSVECATVDVRVMQPARHIALQKPSMCEHADKGDAWTTNLFLPISKARGHVDLFCSVLYSVLYTRGGPQTAAAACLAPLVGQAWKLSK